MHMLRNPKKTRFFKTLFGFLKMDIYKCPRNVQNPFPFLLLAITFLHFSKIKRNIYSYKNVTEYGNKYSRINLLHIFSLIKS